MILLLWAFFIILNGKWTVEIVLFGLGIALVVFGFMCSFLGWNTAKEKELLVHLPLFLLYSLKLLGEIVKANMAVLRRVYSSHPPRPAIVTLRPELPHRWQMQLLANSITLTPGTISVECDADTIVVHCLDEDFARGLAGSALEADIRRMGGRTC